ncbi:pyridoxamine 5'-phosphate oxidase family protein [Nonomuraea sp. NPDC048916]|uniref:pyridoxamine 5'-phosphate oxidase family protein n=1 Tax=Nonomuraea sp. NPDC048916 TaxID=3154232 RepID=UPI0033E3ABB0
MNPITELDARYSASGATATPWSEAREGLERAEMFWLCTIRPDGSPHITPLLAVWNGEALYFCTGSEERKARNLESDPRCTLMTGVNSRHEGLDLIVEGVAGQVTDPARLKVLADAYEMKYGPEWRFEVRDDAFHTEEGGRALVFELAPVRAYGFRKGAYSQTRWRF